MPTAKTFCPTARELAEFTFPEPETAVVGARVNVESKPSVDLTVNDGASSDAFRLGLPTWSCDNYVAVLDSEESFEPPAHATHATRSARSVLTHSAATTVTVLSLPIAAAIDLAVHSRSTVSIIDEGADTDGSGEGHTTEQ